MTEILADIGEFGLIRRIHKLVEQEGRFHGEVTVGIGDDAASLRPGEGCEILVTCDAFVEGEHFIPEHFTPRELGRRAMAANISDIGAMGGVPRYGVVSLGLRAKTPVSAVEEMVRGFMLELAPYQGTIIGGNIAKTGAVGFIDITLIGEVESGRAVRRSTARPGDAILVTGQPGRALAGLLLLRKAGPRESLAGDPMVRAYKSPSPRAKEGRAVALTGRATSMIDISDGFLGDLGHICEQSGVGAKLYQRLLPISRALRQAASKLEMDPLELFFGQSDDYELILTCRPEDMDRIHAAVSAAGRTPLSRIGEITSEPRQMELVQPDGASRMLSATGWNHFA